MKAVSSYSIDSCTFLHIDDSQVLRRDIKRTLKFLKFNVFMFFFLVLTLFTYDILPSCWKHGTCGGLILFIFTPDDKECI